MVQRLLGTDHRAVRVLDPGRQGDLTVGDGLAVGGTQQDLRVTPDAPDAGPQAQRVGGDLDALRQVGVLAVVAGELAFQLDAVPGPPAQHRERITEIVGAGTPHLPAPHCRTSLASLPACGQTVAVSSWSVPTVLSSPSTMSTPTYPRSRDDRDASLDLIG